MVMACQRVFSPLSAVEGDAPPSDIIVAATAEPTNEGLIGLLVTFNLSQPAVGGERIVFELVDGTAVANEDFIPFNPVGIIDFAAGETSQTQMLTLLDDSIVEPDENFFLELSSPTGLVVAQPTLELTILNDDLAPGEDPTLTAQASPTSEDAGSILVTFNLSAPAIGGETVDYSLSEGTASEGDDYPMDNGQVTFQEGETSTTLTVDIVNDDEFEIDETFSVDLSNPSGLQLGLSSLELTILNDDEVPATDLTVTASAPATNEGIIGMVITLELSAPAEGGEGFNFTLNSGTAIAGQDFIDWIGGQVVFEEGETSQNLILTMIDDDVVEPDETFSIEFFNPSGLILSQSSLELTILNDDVGPVDPDDLVVSASASPTNEGIQGIVVEFELSEAASGGESFDFDLIDGTAIVGEDFQDYPGGQIVFEAGETSQTLILTVFDDTVVEPDETFTISFSNPSGLGLDSSSLELTILNDDVNPDGVILVAASAQANNEGIEGISVVFDLSEPAVGGESFNFELIDGTAMVGEDYQAFPGGQVVFEAGETSQTLVLTVIDDSVPEPDETFTISFSNPSGVEFANTSLELTILNDDVNPGDIPTVTASAEPTNEGLIGLPVTFQLSAPAVGGESFNFVLNAGIANPEEDYIDFIGGQVVFNAGETSQTLLLTLVDDAVSEPDEDFTIEFSNPSGLELGSNSLALLILNDDSVLDDYGNSFGLSVPERSIAADGDGDGVGFFLEYAFNLDPTVAASPTYVRGRTLPNGEPFGLPTIFREIDDATGKEVIKYVYIRRTDSYPKVEYFTEVSGDAVNFSPVEPDKVTEITEFWEEVEVIIGHPDGDQNRCFARVRVVANDLNGDGF